jgi:hypothetical protein
MIIIHIFINAITDIHPINTINHIAGITENPITIENAIITKNLFILKNVISENVTITSVITKNLISTILIPEKSNTKRDHGAVLLRMEDRRITN